jgi:hypothetical protein
MNVAEFQAGSIILDETALTRYNGRWAENRSGAAHRWARREPAGARHPPVNPAGASGADNSGCDQPNVTACVGMKMNGPPSRELLRFTADHQWIEENRKALLKQYPDQWIAVKDGLVIASDPELSSLRSRLSDPAHTSVEFLNREPLEMIV